MRVWAFFAVGGLCVVAVGCAGTLGGDKGDGTADGGVPFQRCAQGSCPAPQQCIHGYCIDAPAPCQSDDDCGSDRYCDEGRCVPYGVGPRPSTAPSCTRPVVIGLFSPASQCRWTGSTAGAYPEHRNVMSTPLVADFDFDGDRQAVHPSIVFTSYNCDDGGCGGDGQECYGVIRVIDGRTCRDQFSLALPRGTYGLLGDTTPAIGDLDGDGRPEIVAIRYGGGVAGWSYDAAQRRFVELWPMSYADFNSGQCHWDGLALHDLDDDGRPEIIQATPYPAVYDQRGVLVSGWSEFSIQYRLGLFPVLGDIDGDGKVELVTGSETFRFDPRARRWELAWSSNRELERGHTALGDFGRFTSQAAEDAPTVRDGVPEVVTVASGTVRVQTREGRVVFGPVVLPGGGGGGPPTLADFDGDGRPEIGVAGASAYSVFDLDCVHGGARERCASGSVNGVLWSKEAQDASSNVTGSSVFDFEGDGRAEVVYADECFSRVYDGRTGRVLHSQPHTSCTWYENPVVADVDGDYKSEIVIPSNANCAIECPGLDPVFDGVRCQSDADCPGRASCRRDADAAEGRCSCQSDGDCESPTLACADPPGGTSALGKVCRTRHPHDTKQQGIEVLGDTLDRWVNSRPLWNQHTYSISNVNDDGTVPRTSAWKPNWALGAPNNYRTNSQGSYPAQAAPDVTVRLKPPFACSAGYQLELVADVCNRGTAPLGADVPVRFYRGEASDAPLCETATEGALLPGRCETVRCTVRGAPTSGMDVSVQGDDSGRGRGTTTECNEGNNRDAVRGVVCNIIG